MNKFKIQLGDPSDDGHGAGSDYVINCSITLEEFNKAYEDACKETNFQWNTNGNYTKREGTWLDSKYKILNDYEVRRLTEDQINMFNAFGITIEDNDFGYKTDKTFKLFMDFIKIKVPNIEYHVVTDPEIPTFKYAIGYGIYE